MGKGCGCLILVIILFVFFINLIPDDDNKNSYVENNIKEEIKETQQTQPSKIQKQEEIKPININIEDTIFTILYQYEPFGFYVIKTDDDIFEQPNYGIHLIEELMPHLKFGTENNTILINIFDKNPDIAHISSAKKDVPAYLLQNSTTQLPYAEITFMPDISLSICNYKKVTKSQNNYILSKAYQDWQLKIDDDKECLGTQYLKIMNE